MPPHETIDLTAPRHRGKGHHYRRRQMWSLRPGKRPVPFELISLKCGVLKTVGSFEKASAVLSACLPAAEAMGDRRWAASLAADLAHILMVQGEAGSALPHAERARALFREQGDETGLARATHTLAGIYSDLDQEEKARRLVPEMLELADRTGQAWLAVRVLYGRREELGMEPALEGIRAYLEKARRDGDKPLIASSCFYMGDIYMTIGRWAEAEACNREQYRLAAEIGDRISMSFAIGDRGLIFMGQGRYRDAVECFQEKLEISEAMGDYYNVFEALDNMGVAYVFLGEMQHALELFQRAEAHTRRHQVQHFLSKSLLLKAQCLLELGDVRRAAGANREAMEIAGDIGYSFALFQGALLEARLEAVRDRDRARSLMEGLASQAAGEQDLADLYYELFRLTGTDGHRELALEHNRSNYTETNQHYLARRIQELETK